MNTEIERRFLVKDLSWKPYAQFSRPIKQGYIARVEGGASVRVRLDNSTNAFLNIKQAIPGASRLEYEFPIEVADAEELILHFATSKIEKRRYVVLYQGSEWEIDVFEGRHAGLIIAELELSYEGQPFEMPPWLGEEVTHKEEYSNYRLSQCP